MFETIKTATSAWKDAMLIMRAHRRGKEVYVLDNGTYVIVV